MVESITAKEAAKAELDTTIVGFAIARSVVFFFEFKCWRCKIRLTTTGGFMFADSPS